MHTQQRSRGKLIKLVTLRFLIAIPLLVAGLFLPAGTWNYWEAWVYLITLLTLMFMLMIYLLRNAPDLLERRMRMREVETEQSRLVPIWIVVFLVVYMLPGFDKRFGWSDAPLALILAAQLIVALGFAIVFLVFRENRYASRVVEVEEQQTVVTSGPYALVRHPMYVGVILMYVFSPLALGSYWAMLPALLIIPILAVRMRNEESVLQRDLPGYTAYMQQTRYRLLPGFW